MGVDVFLQVEFPAGLRVDEKPSTLLICKEHLVVVQGAQTEGLALSIIKAMGLIGAAVQVADSLLARASLSSGSDQLNNEAVDGYRARRLVWCKKQNAKIWRLKEKGFLIKSSSEMLYAPFESADGVIHAGAVLWITNQYVGRGKPNIGALDCEIVEKAQGVDPSQSGLMMMNLLRDAPMSDS